MWRPVSRLGRYFDTGRFLKTEFLNQSVSANPHDKQSKII